MKKDIFNKYANLVAAKFNLTQEDLFAKNRREDIVDARSILYYLCLERPIKTSYIKTFMEDNGHKTSPSNILHGYRKAEKLIEEDFDFKKLIEDILNR